MPTFNLTPILFPKPKKDDIYDMLKDFLQIKEKQYAIDEGGEINNPSSYDPLISEYTDIANDPTIGADDRRDAEKMLRDLTIKKLKTDLDRKKDLDESDIKQMITQDLRELEFEFPNNPIAFSTGAMMKFNDVLYGTSERDGLDQVIATMKENYVDTSSLEMYRDVCREELSKYSDIVDAYERGDTQRLSEYAVVYTPFAGKVKAMSIIFKGESDPSNSQKTNLGYTRDDAGNLIVAPSNGTSGMQIYFVRANASQGDKYTFGNSEFNYGFVGWETKNTAGFDYKNIRHAPLHALPSGSFVKDSRGKLYYINRDRSFYPMQEKFKTELGYAEDKVYNLSPDEELNILPGAIDHSTFPVFERYNREASMSEFNSWQSFKEGLGGTGEKIVKGIDIGLGKIGQTIKETPGTLWETTKKAWGEAKTKTPINVPVTPEIQTEENKWGLTGLKELPGMKTAQEFIKGLKIK